MNTLLRIFASLALVVPLLAQSGASAEDLWKTLPEEPPMPKWMSAIDQFTAARSLGLGFLLAALNPKNLTLTLAAAASIAAAGLSSSDSYIVLAVFVVIGTIGLAIPIGVYFLGGDTAAETLAGLRHWLALNNATIMAVLVSEQPGK